jgi:hypothetical protein
MGTKLPPQELELYLAINSLLLNEWDPIGISAFEEAKDEYYPYLPQVFKMIMDNATKLEIADYLNAVVTERMGLNSNFQHSINIAEKALNLKN